MVPRAQLDFARVRVLDGGMATELEFHGADIGGPLWSAHILEDAPEKILAVHRAYLAAGAEVLLTASYQVSRKAYREFGLVADRADKALLRSVELAVEARDSVRGELPERRILVAASLGPYGAALHNGSEYHGNYGCSFAELVEFHRERIAILAESDADLLAFETLPSLEEARAIGEALRPWPELAAWLCFTCKDGEHVAHGEALSACAELAGGLAQTVAIGVNCTAPELLTSLISELRSASDKPIVLYPNSGEGWNADDRCWVESLGASAPADFARQAAGWFAQGAQLIGGCCRTGPEHIRRIAELTAPAN